jgi:hypothetical protein
MWAVRKSHTTKTRARGSFAKGKRRRTNRGQTVDGKGKPPTACPPLAAALHRQKPPTASFSKKPENQKSPIF